MVALAGKKYTRKKSKAPYKLRGKLVALDFETTGLDPWMGAMPFCWSYATDKGEVGFMWLNDVNLKWLQRLFDDPDKQIIFHHQKFDLTMATFIGIDIFNMKAKTHCTLIQAKLTNASWLNYSLKHLGARLLGRPTGDKDEIELWVKDRKRINEYRKLHGRKPNFSDAPTDVIKKRAIWDVETTLLLHLRLYGDIQKYSKAKYKNEIELTFVCIDMERIGVQTDITKAKKLRAKAERDSAHILKDLQALVGSLVVTKTQAGEKVQVEEPTFNPKSPIHLPAAFTKLGIPLVHKTKSKLDKRTGVMKGGGNWAFDEYAMMRYVSDPLMAVMREASEEGWQAQKFRRKVRQTIKRYKLGKKELLPPLVLKYRELQMMTSTFYNAIIDRSVDVFTSPTGNEYGTLHCSFNPSTAITGRFSSSGPNLQNLPRTKGPRECFVARRGRHNWHLDYDQVEMKMFVHFAQDKRMAKAIERDIHRYVASQIYDCAEEDVTKEQRSRGKGGGFGILYGSGAATMAETMTKNGLKTEKKDAVFLVRKYHEEFPSVRKTTRSFEKELRLKGFLVNPHGRRYHIPVKFAYTALNYMCQGTSADIIKEAMVRLWNWLRDGGYKSKLIMTIHDEIVLECPKSEEKVVVPKALRLMEDLHNYFVPITASAEVVTKRWSKKRDAAKSIKDGGMGYKWAV